MKKGLAYFVTFILIASIFVFPSHSTALVYGMDQDLSSVDASFFGESTFDGAGSIKGAGDVNGDGYDDILIAALNNEDGGFNAGQVYLFFGKSSGWNMDTDVSNADASFWGETSGDHAGRTAVGVGDVDNDGYDDFIISAFESDEGGPNTGQIYLILGKATGWSMDTSLSNADASFWGENVDDRSGWAGAGAGDVNGDGYDDILIGVCRNDEGGSEAGQSYLILGKASDWEMDTNLSDSDASFWGEGSGDESGHVVAGAGDVNGDGYDDILIGAPFDDDKATSSGQAYLILGKASGWEMDTNLSNADASYIGESGLDYAGYSLAGAGDVNNDGYEDILISSYGDDDGGSSAGQTYLILGMATGWSTDISLSNANASFWGEDSDDKSGLMVAGAGDVNGDGYDDLLIGAWGDEDGGGAQAGQSYIILGKASGWSMDADLSNADASFWGEESGDYSGQILGGAGDVNGDGYDDIVIGAMYNAEGGNNAGQSYLIFPDENLKPSAISSINTYSDGSFSTVISKVAIMETVYVELQGTDGNSSRKDIAVVNVTSNESSPMGFSLRLIESGLNTGKYQGNFTIMNRTHDKHRWINASAGETIDIYSIQDISTNTSLTVTNPVLKLFPLEDNGTAQEDVAHHDHYWVVGWTGVVWVFETNASWLNWNVTSHSISGIPDNQDVGWYWVRINVTHGIGGSVEHNFTLDVMNTPPDITTGNVSEAVEDSQYQVDYNSSDDGQGTITWHLGTDANGWLVLNSSTGNLSGIPTNSDVGQYYVNVSVDDGNDGWDWTNFSLTVNNTNDAPIISTDDNETAYEDSLYSVQYTALEVDLGDDLEWHLETDTGDWLDIDTGTGLLSGTPSNDDVGSYWVNVSVNDTAQTMDSHNFSLAVVNTNDPPEITSQPETKAIAFFEYTYQVNVSDVDVGDTFVYSLNTAPAGMVIDHENGLVEWTPTDKDEGLNQVIVKVDDGNASVTQDFEINVTVEASYPPRVTLLTPANDSVVNMTNPEFAWSVLDPDTETVYFDVFLSKSKVDVDSKELTSRVAHNLTSRVFIPTSELEKGMTYHWTVIPDDGENIGICSNGSWSFKVEEEAVISKKPVSVLDSPSNGEELVDFPVQLQWSGTDPDSTVIYYDLYLSSNHTLVNGLDVTVRISNAQEDTNYVLTDLTSGSTYHWTVIPSDGENTGNCLSGIWWFKVAADAVENHAPVITSQPIKNGVVEEEYRYDVNATDKDLTDLLTYTLLKKPDGMVMDPETGLIVWTPSNGQEGNHTITVKVSDGKLFIVHSYIITVVREQDINNKPSVTPILDQKGEVGQTYSYQVAANDADIDDVLTYSLDDPPPGMAISPTGLITWGPTKDQVGVHSVIVNVSDGEASTFIEFSISIKKEDQPVQSSLLDDLLLPLLILIIIIVLIVIVAVISKRKRKEPEELSEEGAEYPEPIATVTKEEPAYVIDDIFLVNGDGRLISHHSRRLKPDADAELMTGMFTAILEFAKTSLTTEDGDAGILREMKYGKNTVLIERGKFIYLAAVIIGEVPKALRNGMEYTVTKMEKRFKDDLADWNGDVSSLKGAIRMVKSLLYPERAVEFETELGSKEAVVEEKLEPEPPEKSSEAELEDEIDLDDLEDED